ncbi:MAG TPA: glycosyltransferase, partial [Isosphaeraceae bacterium]|nr:glycosyltransferase [Isosphaeraceae bacterium]
VIIGKRAPKRYGGWYADCLRCLSRPNVHALGWRPQESIHEYNRAFDVCLIPYRADHPFNRVCCPTKIMDYMATGRPVVSTELPECQLYNHLFDVVSDPASFLAAAASIVSRGSDDGRAAVRFEWARQNSCQRVVERLLSWLAARTV